MPSQPPEIADLEHSDARIPYVKQVVLQNFMCHENFKLTLGPSMNVIIGSNGSGKSSILTGIIVALGGRAKTTSRGDSLASLVQTGKTRATVSLRIYIPSEYRQMHQKYGSEVSITRTITSKGSDRGTSLYRLKDAQGRTVKGATARDVRTLCQHFGLYPDNELAMLSQENAKEFLVSATPRIKYEKLRRALLQNMIDHDRALVNSHQKEQEALLGRVRVLRQSALDKEAKADEILSRAQAHANASAQLKGIKLILAWRKASKANEKVKAAEADLANLEAELRELETQLDVDALREGLETQQQELTQERNDSTERRSELQGECDRLRQVIANAQLEYDRTATEIEDLKQQAAAQEQLIMDSERAAAELTPDVVARRKADLETQMVDSDSDRAGAAKAMRDADSLMAVLKDSLRDTGEQRQRAQRRFDEAMQHIRDLENEQRELERGKRAVPSTSAEIHRLQQLVNRERWDRKPVGPLYQYIVMKDEGADFAPALERIWSTTLEGWWVETERDRLQLQALSHRCKVRNLRIFKRKDDPFDFSAALPELSSNYVRAVDVVDAQSDAIKRILVDLNHIESLVLVQSNSAAFEVTDNQIPRNRVRRALSMTIGSGGRRRYVNVISSSGRTESATVEPAQARMKVGVEARTRQLRAELGEKRHELLGLEQRVMTQEQSHQKVKEQIDECSRKRRKSEALRRRAEDQKDALRAQILELDAQVKSFNISEELESTQAKLKELKVQIHDGHDSLQEQREEIDENKTALELAINELRQQKSRLAELDKQLRAIRNQLVHMEDSHNLTQEKYNRRMSRRDGIAAEKRTLEVEHDEKVAIAVQLGANPYEQRERKAQVEALMQESTAELKAKLNGLEGHQEAITAAEEEIRAAEKMKEEAAREQQSIQRSEDEILRLAAEIEQRQRSREENETRSWEAIKMQIKTMFTNTLARRSFRGEVQIDDSGSKLVTHATPGESSNRSTSTLSGGEKSFTQVALLMAVWSTMHVGFVAMDEYDVFMDKVNRSLSLRLLAQVVENKDIQCVLITPQDIDTRALEGMELKIHKLAAARPNTTDA